MKNHWLWMVIGCGLPLLFIFLAPSFGIGGGTSLFIFIIFMFVCHLFMPHGHGRHKHNGHSHTGNDHSKKKLTDESKEEHKGHQHH
jgi:hypothetical protein